MKKKRLALLFLAITVFGLCSFMAKAARAATTFENYTISANIFDTSTGEVGKVSGNFTIEDIYIAPLLSAFNTVYSAEVTITIEGLSYLLTGSSSGPSIIFYSGMNTLTLNAVNIVIGYPATSSALPDDIELSSANPGHGKYATSLLLGGHTYNMLAGFELGPTYSITRTPAPSPAPIPPPALLLGSGLAVLALSGKRRAGP